MKVIFNCLILTVMLLDAYKVCANVIETSDSSLDLKQYKPTVDLKNIPNTPGFPVILIPRFIRDQIAIIAKGNPMRLQNLLADPKKLLRVIKPYLDILKKKDVNKTK